MKTIYKGKHAELCKLIADSSKEDALQSIYSFFRSEDNNDSYSIQLLTIVRELLDDNDSDTIYQLRIRMRSNGDRVLINMAQFMTAFDEGGYEDAAETIAGKCLSELPKLARSMQEFVDEEGISPLTHMAGLRIREAVKLISAYYKRLRDMDAYDKCVEQSLGMTRIFLHDMPQCILEDMMNAAKSAQRRKDDLKLMRLCRDMVENYADKLDELKATSDFSRELLECATSLRFAYETLHNNDPDAPYAQELADLDAIFNDDND